MVSAEEGTDYEENLAPVIEEVDDLSQQLGVVWADGLPAYQGMDHDHRTVIHDEPYVSPDGVDTNQAECLWSLVEPGLAKFRGLLQAGCSHLWLSPFIEPRSCTNPRSH